MLQAGRAGLSEYTTRALLRYASTLQRLAVAQCNGDYPADNGERVTAVCDCCDGLWAPASMVRGTKHADPLSVACPRCKAQPGAPCMDRTGRVLGFTHETRIYARVCRDCRTVELARAVIDEHNRIARGREAEIPCWEIRAEGDPRGYVLRLVPRGTSDEDYQSGRVRPIYVPGRER